MSLRTLLETVANEALTQIIVNGAMLMDALLVIVRSALQRRFGMPVPFELVDAGLRLAFDGGWLRLVDGWVARS